MAPNRGGGFRRGAFLGFLQRRQLQQRPPGVGHDAPSCGWAPALPAQTIPGIHLFLPADLGPWPRAAPPVTPHREFPSKQLPPPRSEPPARSQIANTTGSSQSARRWCADTRAHAPVRATAGKSWTAQLCRVRALKLWQDRHPMHATQNPGARAAPPAAGRELWARQPSRC